MRRLTAALGLVAVVAAAVGWLQSPDHITAAEARSVAESAYAAAGLRGAEVDPDPRAGVYVAAKGSDRVDVWKTSATLDGATVELWLSQVDGESVFFDDRSADGSSQLLTDEQFRHLADHYENPAVGRQIRRNLVLTLAAVLVGLLALRLSLVAVRGPVLVLPVPRNPLRRRSPNAPAFRAPPRPGRPLRARQETS